MSHLAMSLSLLKFAGLHDRILRIAGHIQHLDPGDAPLARVMYAELSCLAVENGPNFLRQIALAERLAQQLDVLNQRATAVPRVGIARHE